MSKDDSNEIIRQRRAQLQELRTSGNAYPNDFSAISWRPICLPVSATRIGNSLTEKLKRSILPAE